MTSSFGAPNDYLIDVWRLDDDLPRDGISSIAQGADGYLWVSSRYGLARFDGLRFVNFSAEIKAPFLGHHYANLISDQFGTVWIGTPGSGLLAWRNQRLLPCITPGNAVFGPLSGGLTNEQGRDLTLSPDGRVLGWSNGTPELVADAGRWGEPIQTSISQDNRGNIWFVTYEHKLVRVAGTNAQEMVYGVGEDRRNWIALQADAAGQLWAGTQRGLGVWHNDQFEPIASPAEPFPVDDMAAVPKANPERSQADARAMARVWVVALGRAWLAEGNHWITNIPFESLAGLYETSPRMADREGNFWFTGTKGGLVRAGPDGGLMRLAPQDGLPPGHLASLCEDREGGIWAGIEHAGLARLRERYFTPLGAREGMKAPPVWAVLEDSSGAVWLGTENDGLHRWQEGKFTQFNLGKNDLAGSVYALCLDRQGTLWAGTGDNGVFRFENGRFVQVWENPEAGWNKRVYVVYEDRRGRMWFGTGLGLFSWQDGELGRHNGKDFQMGVVRVICEDASGRLWVGLSGGAEPRLACLEGEELLPRGVNDGFAGHDIFALHPDADGSLWIGTVDNGLWRWRDGARAHYTTAEGLPDNRIHSIEEDRTGNLWLGSPAGIVRLSKASLASFDAGKTSLVDCLLFNRTDGLPTRECSGGSQPSIAHGRNGRLWFAMTEGAVALSPERIHVNTLPPPVLIEELRVDGKKLDLHAPAQFRYGVPPSGGQALANATIWKAADMPDVADAPPTEAGTPHLVDVPIVSLGPGHHVIEFHYTATSLIAASKVRFKCRLDGVDTEWHDADTARSATYSLNSPGGYQFRVLACNDDGVWNETGANVALLVPPYAWQTLWFRIGLAAVVVAAAGGGIWSLERRRTQRKLEHFARQQMVEQERSRIARDIHDDLGASLTEIGLLSEFVQRDSTPPEQARADARKIAAKANSSTRALDEIVWAVNPRNDTLEGFVTYACAHAEEQLRLADIRCRLEVMSPLPVRLLRADMRHHLFLAFKEAINNIIKHARATEVELSLRVEAEQFSILISDNGCGFIQVPGKAAGSNGGGNGLINMKQRLESVGGGFDCQSAPGHGTRIRLTMKLLEP